MEKYEFKYVFQITRKIMFNVEYYTLGGNPTPHFATSADVFNQPKTDYERCGQCQADVLTGLALEFYEKWDKCHLHDLKDGEWQEVIEDIEELKNKYNYIEKIQPTFAGDYSNISFYAVKELSMLPVKK